MSWEALKERGNALFKEKRYEDAIKFYEKALDINSSIEVLYSNKGTCKKCLKEYKDAINDYKKALELNPKNTKNMNRLASVYIITGQIGEAKLLQEKALNLEPYNSAYREQMTTIEKILEDETKLNDKINEKKFEDAEEVCKRMIEKVSDFSELKLKYIKILIENVKLTEALNYINKEVNYMDKKNDEFDYLTALCLYYDGQYEKAKKQINLMKSKGNKTDTSDLLMYGEGKKKFARVINWDMKNDVGEIGNISKTLISGCFNTKRPYRLMVGGDDGKVNFYEGVPFKHKCEFKEHLGKFVSDIQCSPDGERFVSVGFDKKIVIYEAKEGKILDQFDASKVENGHKMAIISCAFIDDEKLATCSIDRSIKIWDLKEKKLLFTLIPAEGKLGTPYIFCGIISDGKKVVAVTLSGAIYSWNVDTFDNNKLPDLSLFGHQYPVACLDMAKKAKEIITGDTNNTVLIWGENGISRVLYEGGSEKKGISHIALSMDESLVYITEVQGSLLCFDRASGEKKFQIDDIKGNFKSLVPSRKNNDEVYALQTKIIFKIKDGKVEKKVTLSFETKCLEVNEDLGEALVGDKKGKLHVLDMDFKEKGKNDIHFGEYQVIKLSPDGKLLASGDNQRQILVYEADTKKVICDRFGFHTGSIFDLDWSADSKILASASLDGSVMLWEIETKKRLKNYPNFDGNQINQVRFMNDNKDVVCAGQSCNVKEIIFA